MRLQTLQRKLAETRSVALVPSGPDLFYLTGLKDAGLWLWADGMKTVLLGSNDEHARLWDDEESLQEKARRGGIGQTAGRAELSKRLVDEAAGLGEILLPFGVDGELETGVFQTLAMAGGRNLARVREGGIAVRDLRSVLGSLRNVKEARESDAMRRAAGITAEGHRAVMKRAHAGQSEADVATIFLSVISAKGAGETAYGTIVGSGPRACVLHARAGDRVLRSGELVLMDAAAKKDGYCSDVTRTFPVDAKFTREQREIYELVLKAQKAAIAAVKPGATLGGIHELARDTMVAGLEKLGVTDARERIDEWFPHGTSHWIGIEVHDSCPRRKADGSEVALAPGMVLTVEPGLYFRDENAPAKYRGMGVRIEDDVLVTATGNEVLSAGLEKEADEIEFLRSQAFSTRTDS